MSIRPIEFTSDNIRLVGTLYLPEDFAERQKYIGVVVTGSWFTVKEQMSAIYARRLAKQGLVALTFDFRYFGASEGQPREYEMPADKVKDIKAAVAYLKSLSFIDDNKIAGLGICLSAGMMAAASTESRDIQAIALVAPGLQNRGVLRQAFGSETALQARIDEGREAREKYEASGEIDYIPVVSTSDKRAAVVVPDATDYYLDQQRGAIAEWPNRFAVMSWEPFITFDSVAIAQGVRAPILMVHSESGANPEAAKDFYADLPTTTHKECYWMPGAQYDFYDQEPQVTKAVGVVSTFFKTVF